MKTKYNINKDYFRIIDSNEKPYFLGLMYADGYVSERSIVLSLQEGDKLILEKFKKSIEYNGPIRFSNKNNIK